MIEPLIVGLQDGDWAELQRRASGAAESLDRAWRENRFVDCIALASAIRECAKLAQVWAYRGHLPK